MSYSFINNCNDCKSSDKCTDYKKIQDSIYEIHSENHVGYGKVYLICFKNMQNLNFGQAIEFMKQGHKLARQGWNGKGIFIQIQFPDSHSKMSHPYIYIDTTGLQTDNEKAPKNLVPWFASQTDMLSDDWRVVE